MTQKIAMVEYGNTETADVFEFSNKKTNNKISMSENDVKLRTLVYCQEPYAQALFNVYADNIICDEAVSKDIRVGESVNVKATSYSMTDKLIRCEMIGNGALVIIPMSEFIHDITQITGDDVFEVVITKEDCGAYTGTCKNPTKYREELELSRIENTWFDVKIISLIRGGYRALYKETIECFVPGSHAAANIIGDFQELIGTKMTVMVDNYDWSSRMYVVSYKKYVKQSLPIKIHEIKFGHKYKGVLTSNPTDFGLFIEFENYYTGLAHRVDFANYDDIRKQYKAGDEIEVYVKNITEKQGNYRIVLTLNEADIDRYKMIWYNFKTNCQGKVMDYVYSVENKNLTVTVTGTEDQVTIALPRDFDFDSIADYKRIAIHDINVLRQEIKFDFCK